MELTESKRKTGTYGTYGIYGLYMALTKEQQQIFLQIIENFPVFAETFLKIRAKDGVIKPFILNKPQIYLHGQIEDQIARTGMARKVILKGRQQGMCYTPDMRVLTAQHQWVQIGDVQVGDKLIAVDEYPPTTGRIWQELFGNHARRVFIAGIEAIRKFKHEAYSILLDNGVTIKATAEHRHLCGVVGDSPVWRTVADMKPGDAILSITTTDHDGGGGRKVILTPELQERDRSFWRKVISIQPLGVRDVVDIQTSEKTFICEGIVSHNSTFVGGRFYRNTAYQPGKKCYILTHEQAATDNLFNMVKHYHENVPEDLRPTLGASNAKELIFPELNSGYKVATAGNKGAGRSDTSQFVHASEVGYWPNGEEHIAGLMQTVPSAPGTEIIVESTANGIGNIYHELWEKASQRKGGWEPVFIPWFWQDEYSLAEHRAASLGISLSAEDREYADLHNLSLERALWRRFKVDEMGQEALFRREYPTTPAEAFDSSNELSFMQASDVDRARKSPVKLEENGHAPTILGVDPARSGVDSTAIVLRKGRFSEKLKQLNGNDTMSVVGTVLGFIQKYKPHAVFIDQGGIGAGIVDRLRELGFTIVRGVDFGGKPLNDKLYTNKRNEMWGLMKQWILDQPAKIADDDSLHIDLTGINISRYDSHNRAILESKDEFKKRFHRSPDVADALALTFAFPVIDYDAERKMMRQVAQDEGDDYEDIKISVPGMGY